MFVLQLPHTASVVKLQAVFTPTVGFWMVNSAAQHSMWNKSAATDDLFHRLYRWVITTLVYQSPWMFPNGSALAEFVAIKPNQSMALFGSQASLAADSALVASQGVKPLACVMCLLPSLSSSSQSLLNGASTRSSLPHAS